MNWIARYTGPHGIDTSLDAPTWIEAANHLRALLEAATPEGFYLPAVAALREALPGCGFSVSDGRHSLILRDETMPPAPWEAQPDLFDSLK